MAPHMVQCKKKYFRLRRGTIASVLISVQFDKLLNRVVHVRIMTTGWSNKAHISNYQYNGFECVGVIKVNTSSACLINVFRETSKWINGAGCRMVIHSFSLYKEIIGGDPV